jgi:hypothetical protein
MQEESIAKFNHIKTDVLSLIMDTPINEYEIEVKGILISIHQKLLTIKVEKLGQIAMPEPKSEGKQLPMIAVPDKECPTCKGKKTVAVGDGEPGTCPTCLGFGTVKALPGVKETPAVVAEKEKIANMLDVPVSDIHTLDIQEGKLVEIIDPEPAAVDQVKPYAIDKELLDKILAVNSSSSLMEKPPRLLGGFVVPSIPQLADKQYICVGSVWSKESKEVSAICRMIVTADKFEGKTHDKYNGDGVSFEGLKVTYKDVHYVITSEEVSFLVAPPEAPEKVKKPRKPRVAKTVKDASPVTPPETAPETEKSKE